MRKRMVLVLYASLAAGCGGETAYSPKPLLLPPHIRTIAIRPLANHTGTPGLERKLHLQLSQDFIRDGRLPLVSDEREANGIIAGDIARYIKQPISFDANGAVLEYRLLIVIDIHFIDRTSRAVLWEEPRLEHAIQFLVETLPGGRTEEEAREELWKLFSKDIVKRTLDGFGSVSGASSRKLISHPVETSTSPERGLHGPY